MVTERTKKETVIRIPRVVGDKAKTCLQFSGFTSLSDCGDILIRRWIEIAENHKKTKSKMQLLSDNTRRNTFPLWMSNFKANWNRFQKYPDIKEIKEKPGPAIIIGAGPSLKKNKHIEMLIKNGYDGTTVCTDRALIHCLEKGLIPDYVVSLDADPVLVDFYDHHLVRKHADEITAIFACTVHPSIIDVWPGKDIYFFSCRMDNPNKLMSISNAMMHLTGGTILETGGNVGVCSMFISHLVKKSPIVLIGMDLGWTLPLEVDDITKLESWGIYEKMHNGDINKVKKCFRRGYNSFFKKEYIVDFIFDVYLESTRTWIEGLHKREGWKVINCTGGGALHDIPGMKEMHLEDFLKSLRSGKNAKKGRK